MASQDLSATASTALLVSLFTILGCVAITKPHMFSGINASLSGLQDTPKETGSIGSISQEREQAAVTTNPPYLLGRLANAGKSRGFTRQSEAWNKHLSLQVLETGLGGQIEVPSNSNIHQSLRNHNHYDEKTHDNVTSKVLKETCVMAHLHPKKNIVRGRSRRSVPPVSNLTHMSTFANMYLCDHPPKTFSSTFLGHPWEACLRYDRKWVQPLTDLNIVCGSIHTLTESNPKKFMIGLYHHSELGPMKVITNKNYVQSCLPLFRRFSKCEERDFLTICWKEKVVFLHSHNCPRSSNDIFLAYSLLRNDTYCFHEFCEGWQSVVDSEVGGVVYRLTNNRHVRNRPSCGNITVSLTHIYRNYNGTLYLLINNRWPCCYPLYLVIWAGRPEAHGLNGAWSYLPPACQAGEVLLLLLVGCVMLGGVGGNLMVLVVMVSGGHRSQDSSLLRTSLAFADLLTASFVVVPSFVQHLLPFLSSPQYFTVSPEMMLTTSPINVSSSLYITSALHGWSGFPLFQSILFSTTSTVSLLMLLVLSLERFIITGRYLHYRDYFSYCRTVLAIAVAWVTSLANALWFAASEDGGLGAQWLTFEKLPTGASGFGPGGVRNVIYHGQFVILLMLGLSVVIFSSLAIRNFVREQLHVAAEWRSLKMKASRQYSRDNRHVLTNMTLMLISFLTSTVPLAVNITMNSVSYEFHEMTLFSYLSWWLFVAASAWNPWLYNIRSKQFKEEMQKFQRHARQGWRRPSDNTASSPSGSHPSESLQLTSRHT